ncbi:Ig-like domain-containing protein [Candidatus Cloacimonadota bacterium]
MMNRSFKFFRFQIFLLLLILISCGHKKTATGGKIDTVKPEIVSIDPFELESIEEGRIEITFSKPIDRTSILSGITIYPPILRKKFKWDGNTLIIRILEDLEDNTNYYFTFSSKIEGEHGNNLNKDYLYVFRNGELSENRISGNIIYEKEADLGDQIRLILQSADSTFIFSKYIYGTSYDLDYLNSGSHLIRAFIDKNNNKRYDYGTDPYFQTTSSDIPVQTIDLEIAYQDTIKPEPIKAKVYSRTQIEVELSEPCKTIKNVVLLTADSLMIEIPVIATSLLENDLKILCAPLDTLKYDIQLIDLTDLKGNVRSGSSIIIQGITVNDSIPPEIISTVPKNGATLNTLLPKFEILFSEIILKEDITAGLSSNEDRVEVGLKILSADSEIAILEPVKKLKNYSTYTITVSVQDNRGNILQDELIQTFIPILKEEK